MHPRAGLRKVAISNRRTRRKRLQPSASWTAHNAVAARPAAARHAPPISPIA